MFTKIVDSVVEVRAALPALNQRNVAIFRSLVKEKAVQANLGELGGEILPTERLNQMLQTVQREMTNLAIKKVRDACVGLDGGEVDLPKKDVFGAALPNTVMHRVHHLINSMKKNHLDNAGLKNEKEPVSLSFKKQYSLSSKSLHEAIHSSVIEAQFNGFFEQIRSGRRDLSQHLREAVDLNPARAAHIMRILEGDDDGAVNYRNTLGRLIADSLVEFVTSEELGAQRAGFVLENTFKLELYEPEVSRKKVYRRLESSDVVEIWNGVRTSASN
jgi:hypothetical protein